MGNPYRIAAEKWKRIKSTSGFHNTLLFLIFICVSALFWFILALNDSAQESFNVRLNITNVPDTVTFISDIPDRIHVNVRDKGTNLWRSGFLKNPTVNIDFKEYASNGILRYSYSDLLGSLRTTFGQEALVTSVSIDSLRLIYTTNKGKRVPIVVECKVFPASGSIMEGRPVTSPASVYVFGERQTVDTVNMVYTEPIELKDISETTVMKVKLKKVNGARVVPSSVELTVPIEPLVKKEAMITITPINVPEKESLLLFPSKVPVSYYVAMSRLGDDDDDDIELLVDYNEIDKSTTGKLHVDVSKHPERLRNLTLKNDSVEYAVVKE